MTSSTGWRETARMSAKRAFVVRLWPLSRMARRMLCPSGCGLNRCECGLVLSRGLADRGADHELEDLVVGEAGHSNRRDIIVGDLVGVLGDLLDHCAQRLWQSRVVEGGAAQVRRGVAASIEDSRYKSLSCLSDIRHLPPPFSHPLTSPLELLLTAREHSLGRSCCRRAWCSRCSMNRRTWSFGANGSARSWHSKASSLRPSLLRISARARWNGAYCSSAPVRSRSSSKERPSAGLIAKETATARLSSMTGVRS